MAKKLERLEADVVIAGAGPGGTTVARELSNRGKRAILIEKGRYRQKASGHLAFFRSMAKFGRNLHLRQCNRYQRRNSHFDANGFQNRRLRLMPKKISEAF